MSERYLVRRPAAVGLATAGICAALGVASRTGKKFAGTAWTAEQVEVVQ